MKSSLFEDSVKDDVLSEGEQPHDDDDGFRLLSHQERRENLKSKTQDREQRKEFASKIYSLTIGWLVCVVLILLFQGWGIAFSNVNEDRFYLSDKVLIALITGASINIIGLMAIVIRYLFPPNKRNNEQRN